MSIRDAIPLLPFEIDALAKEPNGVIWLDPDRIVATLVKQQNDLVNMNELLKQNSAHMTAEGAARIEEINRQIQTQRDEATGQYNLLVDWLARMPRSVQDDITDRRALIKAGVAPALGEASKGA